MARMQMYFMYWILCNGRYSSLMSSCFNISYHGLLWVSFESNHHLLPSGQNNTMLHYRAQTDESLGVSPSPSFSCSDMSQNSYWAPQQVSHDGQRRRLHGKQVVVVYVWAAAPHELGQAEQVLQVVARLAMAHGDLGADLLRTGRSQVEGVVGCGDVEQRLHRWLALVISMELHHLGGVAAAHRLTHVQVLEGLLHLRARHLEGHAPGARLQGKNTFNGEASRLHLSITGSSWRSYLRHHPL